IYNVNGTSASSNNIRIDGASSTNVWLPHMSAYVPALEAIESVNVATSTFDAEQGLAGGSAVNVQIKSGTNNLHGSVFEYHNNNRTKAKPTFIGVGQDKPKLVYNQFGATVGGPVKRDKIFYFFAYEGTRNREFASRFLTVPTPAIKAGDMSASPNEIYDPLTGAANGTGRTAFPLKRVPAARLDPIVQKIIPLIPNPTEPGLLTSNFYANGGYIFDRDTFDAKVNWSVGSKLTMYARTSYLKYNMDNQQAFGELGGPEVSGAGGNPGHGFGHTYSSTLSATYIATPNLVLDAYFGHTLMDTNVEQVGLDKKVGLDVLGIPGTNGPRRFEGGWPRFSVDSYADLGVPNAFMPYYRHDPVFQYVGNANWNKGTHNIRFGADIYRQHHNHNQP
ncbi:MAG: hypothetical protein ACRD96_29450, partial [Bryobacteraceae bacterium]